MNITKLGSILIAFLMLTVTLAQTQLSPAVTAVIRVQDPVIALEHVRVIDGTGAAAKTDQTILISGGKIATVGNTASVPVPDGAKRIDLAGFSALPGLVGMHEHLFYPSAGGLYHDMPFSFPRLYLAAGVTTIRTGGSIDPYSDLELKRRINEGKIPGPKINLTSPYLEGSGTPVAQFYQLTGPDDATRTVDYWAQEGMGSFKANNYLTRAELKAAIDAAHKHKLKITGHLCSIGYTEAAEMGIDNLEHGLIVDTEFFPGKRPDVCPDVFAAITATSKLEISGEPIQTLIKTLVARHIAITSTLPVFEVFVATRPDIPQEARDMLCETALKDYQANRSYVAQNKDSPFPVMFKKEMEFELAFVRAGGTLLAGLDPTGLGGVIAGYGDHREVELLVEAGFTPLEAIKIASLNGAIFLGEQDHVGSIAVGKQADLMIVKGDPSTNIADIEKVDLVFKDGIGYDSKKLRDAARGQVGIR